MNKNHTGKILTIGIIVLFIGVSVSSAISIDTKSTISNNQNEECKSCGEVSKSDFIKVERLLNRLEIYSKLLLVLSRYNPELKEINEELSDDISSLKEIDFDSQFCDWLQERVSYYFDMAGYFANLASQHMSNPDIFFLIFYVMGSYYLARFLIANKIYDILCE